MSGELSEHSYGSSHSACQATHMALHQMYARRAWLYHSARSIIFITTFTQRFFAR
jgi:hypothetical protein